jgi:hypothetical protein
MDAEPESFPVVATREGRWGGEGKHSMVEILLDIDLPNISYDQKIQHAQHRSLRHAEFNARLRRLAQCQKPSGEAVAEGGPITFPMRANVVLLGISRETGGERSPKPGERCFAGSVSAGKAQEPCEPSGPAPRPRVGGLTCPDATT